MDSTFNSLVAINKLSNFTKNLSGNHSSRRVCNGLKSINDIRKTDLTIDLNKKYFGVFSDRNGTLKDLMKVGFNSVEDKQLSLQTTTNEVSKECLSKDQSVQTDIRQFAKMNLLSGKCEKASNYMQLAEKFIEQLESQCPPNAINFSPIPIYWNSRRDFSEDNNHFNGNESFESHSTNDRTDHQIINTNNISEVMKKYCRTQSSGDIVSNDCRLILDSNIKVYEADNCHDYEFGEEAVESESHDYYDSEFCVKSYSNYRNFSKISVGMKSEPSIEWSDLVQLIKSNKLSKKQFVKNLSNKISRTFNK